MSKKKIATLIVTVMLIMLVGCSDSDYYNTAEGKGLFVEINIDYSKTLTTDTSCYHYYYLKDTGIVYVGWIGRFGLNGSSDTVSQVISPNGNYYRYDVEEQMVVEIVEDTN